MWQITHLLTTHLIKHWKFSCARNDTIRDHKQAKDRVEINNSEQCKRSGIQCQCCVFFQKSPPDNNSKHFWQVQTGPKTVWSPAVDVRAISLIESKQDAYWSSGRANISIGGHYSPASYLNTLPVSIRQSARQVESA